MFGIDLAVIAAAVTVGGYVLSKVWPTAARKVRAAASKWSDFRDLAMPIVELVEVVARARGWRGPVKLAEAAKRIERQLGRAMTPGEKFALEDLADAFDQEGKAARDAIPADLRR